MKLRLDIQALRGLAVLSVLLYHTKFGVFGTGYLGVDIFFVISGFLITGQIASAIERGRFHLLEFYFRRAKRLLPAAYTAFLVTAVAAPYFLGPIELDDFEAQMFGALTFTANLTLWKQSGYFEGASELKPLLHVWSLSLEEQFYLVLPATLLMLPRRRWLLAASAVVAGSFGLSLFGNILDPSATFYLLPTRAWELALGSVGALIQLRAPTHILVRALYWPSTIALVLLPLAPFGTLGASLEACLVCSATLVFVLRRHSAIQTSWITRSLAAIGDFSYSLYLAHWPIFSFAKNAWVSDARDNLPTLVRISCLVLSLLAGYLLYRLVEVPLRRRELQPTLRLAGGGIAASLALAALTAVISRPDPLDSKAGSYRAKNFGLGERCLGDASFEASDDCTTSPRPRLLVWGDSFAIHLVPGLVASSGDVGLVQATKSFCGPLLGLAPMKRVAGSIFNRAWAERCIEFNQSVVAYLTSVSSLDVVVLASAFGQYVESRSQNLQRAGPSLEVVPANATTALHGLRRTVEIVRALGRRVVVVAPPPSSSFDAGSCVERLLTRRIRFGVPADCAIDRAESDRRNAEVRELLSRLADDAKVPIYTFEQGLCHDGACTTRLGDIPLYRDAVHFSIEGSKRMGERLGLAHALVGVAR